MTEDEQYDELIEKLASGQSTLINLINRRDELKDRAEGVKAQIDEVYKQIAKQHAFISAVTLDLLRLEGFDFPKADG